MTTFTIHIPNDVEKLGYMMGHSGNLSVVYGYDQSKEIGTATNIRGEGFKVIADIVLFDEFANEDVKLEFSGGFAIYHEDSLCELVVISGTYF